MVGAGLSTGKWPAARSQRPGKTLHANPPAAGRRPPATQRGLCEDGFPTFGERILFGAVVVIDAGRFSFGNLRESKNAPLAERCLPTFGFRMRPW